LEQANWSAPAFVDSNPAVPYHRASPPAQRDFPSSMNWFDNFQSLRQEGERDCSIPIFGKLAGVSREKILHELPEAVEGKVTVAQWEDWLRSKNLNVTRHDGSDEHYELPCAHLVQPHSPHWIYEDAHGVLDPSPVFGAMPPDDPRMREWAATYGGRILTISVKPLKRV
jgi:hypothetical protein